MTDRHLTHDGAFDRTLNVVSALAIMSYVVFYVLLPHAYIYGPAILLLFTFFGFRWSRISHGISRDSLLFGGAFLAYFLVKSALNVVHGEGPSEYDLISRFLAATLILLWTLKYCISPRLFFALVASGASVTGGVAIYEAVFSGAWRVATYDNAVHYGNGALVLGLLALSGLVWSIHQPRRLLWSLALVLAGVLGGSASILSGTRSGWVALPVVAIVALYAVYPLMRHKGRDLAIMAATIGVVFAGILQIDSVGKRVEAGVQEYHAYFEKGKNGTSVGLRLDMYKAGMAAFEKNPLIGVGPSGYSGFEARLIEDGKVHPNVADFRHRHNQYVDEAAKGGVIALGAYLIVLIVPFVLFARRLHSKDAAVRALALGGAVFMSAHAIFNLTQSLLERNIGVMMFVIMPVFIWSLIDRREAQLAARRES